MNSFLTFKKLYSSVSNKHICLWNKLNISNFSPETVTSIPPYFSFSNTFSNFDIENILNTMTIQNDFLNEDEEKSLMDELDPYMKKLRYEFDHWDDAIHGYRETERLKWNEENTKILNRIKMDGLSLMLMPQDSVATLLPA
ncbi:uncharacterized protein LOC143192781 isoform X2 [Rhynchophorus ferrugineus]|uniref:uncharacterized protein LOC143192781 isoform X2 n=1 Tax=Rhynchophorus ferrugineus TaxID=354439 RepID=UPI003FCC2F81